MGNEPVVVHVDIEAPESHVLVALYLARPSLEYSAGRVIETSSDEANDLVKIASNRRADVSLEKILPAEWMKLKRACPAWGKRLQIALNRVSSCSDDVFYSEARRAFEATRTFDILGHRMRLGEINKTFGIARSEFVRRVDVYGMPPHEAALMPMDLYRSISHSERLLIGWRYWCNQSNPPLPETDIDMRLVLPGIISGVWIPRDIWNGTLDDEFRHRLCCQSLNDGQRRAAYWIWRSSGDELELLQAWFQMVAVTFALRFPVEGRPYAAGDGCDNTPMGLRTIRSVSYHHKSRMIIPPELYEFWNDDSSVLGKLEAIKRSSDVCIRHVSVFNMLGLVAELRRKARDCYYLSHPVQGEKIDAPEIQFVVDHD